MKKINLLSAAVLGLFAFTACEGGSGEGEGEGEGEAAEGEGETGEGEGETGEGESEPIASVVVSIDGVETVVTNPAVRRGLQFTPPVSKTVSGTYGQSLSLSCSPDGPVDQGGRVIVVRAGGVAGSIVGNCRANPAVIPGAENGIRDSAGSQCGGRNSCTYDPTPTVDATLFECTPSGMTYSVQYDCRALDPAPLFVVSTPAFVFQGMESVGTASCTDRFATIFVDNGDGLKVAEFDPARCNVTVDARGDRNISGHIEATLISGGVEREFVVTFDHNRNTLRPIAGMHLGNDVCQTSDVTHTVRTEGAETFDDFVTGPLNCQVSGGTQPAMTLVRRRVIATSSQQACGPDARFNVAVDGLGGTGVTGGCSRVVAPSDSDNVLRVVVNELQLCVDFDCTLRPVAFLSIGVGDAAAPLP